MWVNSMRNKPFEIGLTLWAQLKGNLHYTSREDWIPITIYIRSLYFRAWSTRNKLWQMLRSNYCSTPYSEHYCESIGKHVFNPAHRLVDYNHDWLALLCKLIGIDTPPLVHAQDDSPIILTEFYTPKHHLFQEDTGRYLNTSSDSNQIYQP